MRRRDSSSPGEVVWPAYFHVLKMQVVDDETSYHHQGDRRLQRSFPKKRKKDCVVVQLLLPRNGPSAAVLSTQKKKAAWGFSCFLLLSWCSALSSWWKWSRRTLRAACGAGSEVPKSP